LIRCNGAVSDGPPRRELGVGGRSEYVHRVRERAVITVSDVFIYMAFLMVLIVILAFLNRA
jgi:hypothetical protein